MLIKLNEFEYQNDSKKQQLNDLNKKLVELSNLIKQKDELIDELNERNNSIELEENDMIYDLGVSPINPSYRKRESIVMPNLFSPNINKNMRRVTSLNKFSIVED